MSRKAVPETHHNIANVASEGDYVDLTQVPEHYTGYSGEKAHRVWRTIYDENCFGVSELDVMTGRVPANKAVPDTMSGGNEEGEQCLEKRVYYKIISGTNSISFPLSLPILIWGDLCRTPRVNLNPHLSWRPKPNHRRTSQKPPMLRQQGSIPPRTSPVHILQYRSTAPCRSTNRTLFVRV